MTPFDDLDTYLALPRVSGLAVTPDGRRAVTMISELNDKGTEYVTAAWELDPDGQREARRLTYGAKGESRPTFTAAGDLLFVAARATDSDDDPPAALWKLPANGGEAQRILELAGGVSGVHTARSADVVVVTAPMLPSAGTPDDDKRLRSTATYLDRGLVGDLIASGVKFDVKPREEPSFLLSLLARLSGGRAVVEVGTGAGVSGLDRKSVV